MAASGAAEARANRTLQGALGAPTSGWELFGAGLIGALIAALLGAFELLYLAAVLERRAFLFPDLAGSSAHSRRSARRLVRCEHGGTGRTTKIRLLPTGSL